jgi:hypothetical protein
VHLIGFLPTARVHDEGHAQRPSVATSSSLKQSHPPGWQIMGELSSTVLVIVLPMLLLGVIGLFTGGTAWILRTSYPFSSSGRLVWISRRRRYLHLAPF